MNGNYAWEKHQAQEKLQARRREAERNRLAKQNNSDGESESGKILLAFLLFVISLIVFYYLPV